MVIRFLLNIWCRNWKHFSLIRAIMLLNRGLLLQWLVCSDVTLGSSSTHLYSQPHIQTGSFCIWFALSRGCYVGLWGRNNLPNTLSFNKTESDFTILGWQGSFLWQLNVAIPSALPGSPACMQLTILLRNSSGKRCWETSCVTLSEGPVRA